MTEKSRSDKKHNPGFKYSAEEAAEKMIDEVNADTGAWNEGVQRTGVDVIGRAASDEAEKNFKQAMLKVINQKMRQAGLGELSTEEWKAIIEGKSINWSGGVNAKRDKILDKLAEAIGVTYDVADEVRKMPKGLPGSAENKARMNKYFDERVKAKEEKGA